MLFEQYFSIHTLTGSLAGCSFFLLLNSAAKVLRVKIKVLKKTAPWPAVPFLVLYLEPEPRRNRGLKEETEIDGCRIEYKKI